MIVVAITKLVLLFARLSNRVSLLFCALTGNDITGSLPSTLSSWTNLDYFAVNQNEMTGPLDVIAGWNQLTFFFAFANSFTGTLPNEIGQFVNIERFNVRGNLLTGTIPESIENWVNFEYGTSLSSGSQVVCARCPPCECSNRKKASISHRIVLFLSSAYFHDNNFVGSVPAGICTANTFTELEADCELECSCCTDCS